MIDVVRLYRNAAEEYGRDLFACSPEEWRFLIELGRTFGWQPRGTTYQLPAGSKRESVALRNYEAGTKEDRKLVSAEDALDWARALATALRSSHFASMIEAGPRGNSGHSATPQLLADLVAEFTQYAFGGAFAFALEEDDAQSESAV